MFGRHEEHLPLYMQPVSHPGGRTDLDSLLPIETESSRSSRVLAVGGTGVALKDSASSGWRGATDRGFGSPKQSCDERAHLPLTTQPDSHHDVRVSRPVWSNSRVLAVGAAKTVVVSCAAATRRRVLVRCMVGRVGTRLA